MPTPKMPKWRPEPRRSPGTAQRSVPSAAPLTSSPEAGADGPTASVRLFPTATTVPTALVEVAGWAWRLLLVGALVYVAAHLLGMVPLVTIPLVIALLLSSVLAPVRRLLNSKLRIPHTLASLLALLIGVGVIGVVVKFVIDQTRAHAAELADGVSTIINDGGLWLQTGPLQVDDGQVQTIVDEITGFLSRNQEQLLTGAISTVSALTEVLAGMLLILLATFFLLRDGELIWSWVLSLVPSRGRRRVDQLGRAGWFTVGGFVRGQSTIALLHAITVFIVLLLLNVPLATVLSVLVFIGSFIPILGMVVVGTLCVIVSLIENGLVAAVVLAIVIVVMMQVEANLLQPIIMSHNVEIHPLAVAVAVLAGTSLAGIAGALFAVPLVAFINAMIRELKHPLQEGTQGAEPVEASEPAVEQLGHEAQPAGTHSADNQPAE